MTGKGEQPGLKYHDLNVKSKWGADDEIKKHISKVVLGTPGKMRYRHINVLDKIEKVGDTLFLTLYKAGRLLGTVGLIHRLVENEDNKYNAFFIRYFSIFSPMRSKKHRQKKLRREEDKSFIIKDKIKEEVERMDSFIVDPEHRKLKTVSYAFIEKDNQRSLDFSEMIGYKTLGMIHTILFSRFFPKKHKNVRLLRKDEREQMKKSIKEFYSDHNMFFSQYLDLDNDYLVIEEDGEIVAGLQVDKVDWEVLELPGLSGWFLLNVFPRVPMLRKIFNARELGFVTYEAIWFKKGKEKYLSQLFETACANYDVGLGMAWFDTRSIIYSTIKKAVRYGFLASVQGSTPGLIRFKPVNISSEEEQDFYRRPVYVSAYDMT